MNKAKGSAKSGKGLNKTKIPEKVGQINTVYQGEEFKSQLKEAFTLKKELLSENGAVLHTEPFTCGVLPNFVTDHHFLEGLKSELLDQIFIEKNNDLYKFQQSDDLKKFSTPFVHGLKKLLCGDVLGWFREITGMPLSSKVDMTCSKYDYTDSSIADTLLCHDDELEGRRIAYVLYLVPPWKESDGGLLDMFDMDENFQPTEKSRTLVPQWNNLVWFEVTAASHHQVSEVLSKDKSRLSVNGWFHGPPVTCPPPYIEPPRPVQSHGHVEEEVVYEWISEIYLDPEVQSQIQEKFEENSEIELQGFLKEEKYQALVSALKSEGVQWCKRGPPNKRCYHASTEASLPSVVQQCLQFLRSEAMFLILSNLTGLSLHALAANNETDSEDSDAESFTATHEGTGKSSPSKSGCSSSSDDRKAKSSTKRRRLNSKSNEDSITNQSEKNPTCKCEVRKWAHGDYTLVHDTDAELSEFALDAMLFCSCKGWEAECGGYTSYIARGEDEELLTVNPVENSLALVYRDKETLKFVKHINDRISETEANKEFYDIALTYCE